ncbi:MAG: 1-acyl-sn-glycerol-3-phosphate acyltransferase, partial [Actinomycetota bacterium]|nr:1-acyl-sn-glycerol-3-phosphate acyltransferase [Actinomycetota bacterium]
MFHTVVGLPLPPQGSLPPRRQQGRFDPARPGSAGACDALAMVALRSVADEATRRRGTTSGTPGMWRALTAFDRLIVRSVGRIEITGEFPPHLRGRPVLVAANHIGMFDPFVLIAAGGKTGIAPRFLLTAGLLDAPILGFLLRKSGHLRV